MAIQTLTVRLPDRLYAQLRDRAQQANRTMEAELVDLVATAMPEQGELSDELGLELAGLEHLDDEALWQAAGAAWQRRWLGARRNFITNGSAKGSPMPRGRPSPN